MTAVLAIGALWITVDIVGIAIVWRFATHRDELRRRHELSGARPRPAVALLHLRRSRSVRRVRYRARNSLPR